MTQGGGFSSGEDFVAAKVVIDVPTEGIQTLKEMSNAINNFRTAVEAAARSDSSFSGMLQQMTQAANMATEAHRNLTNQLQQTADMQQRMQTGGAGGAAQLPLSRNAPQGFVDNFAGMGIGMGMGGGRSSPSDVPQQLQQQQIDPTRQLDPRKYVNAQAGRNRMIPGELTGQAPGSIDWGQHADRVEARDRVQREQEDKTPGGRGPSLGGMVSKYGGLAANMGSELAVGGSHIGMLGMAARGMGALGRHIDAAAGPGATGTENALAASKYGSEAAEGMGIGSLLKGGGAAVGIGAAALGALQKGGAMYQGYKNMGLIQGGGAGQGVQDEMQVRSMALNPFLSTEQARQIVMAGLTEGYRGKTFDTVTQFMASNLKDMNLAQPYQAKVLTPAGWAKIGELAVGDQVIAGDGTVTEIVKVSERGTNEVYEVKFDDDTSTRCTMDHLWFVYQTNEKTPRVKFLKDLVSARRKNSSGVLMANGWPRYRVPLVRPVQFEQQNVPIDPYVLGILLGDGAFGHGHVSVTCAEEEFYDLTLPDGVIVKRAGTTIQYRLTGNWNRWNRNPLMVALEGLGLGGITTHAKFIPEIYLRGSIGQRFALLQGLVDTDGHIDKNGIVFFTNASSQLINDVRSLVLSLGGSVTIREVQPLQTTMKTGYIINSGLCYRMQLRLPGHLGAPCRLTRKATRYIPRMLTDRKRTKGIISVTQVDNEQCRCIQIAHPDQLYVTDDYTVTHNSVSDSVQLLRKNVNEGGQSIMGLGASLGVLKEMSKKGALSGPDLQQMFKQGTADMVSQGIGGGAASQDMTIALGGFNKDSDQAIKGQFASVVDQMGGTAAGGAFLEAYGGGPKVSGLNPEMYGAYVTEHGGSMADVTSNAQANIVKRLFKNYPKGSPQYLSMVPVFMGMMRKAGVQSEVVSDKAVAMQYIDAIREGRDPAKEGREENNQITGQVSGQIGLVPALGQEAGAIGNFAKQVGGSIADVFTGNWGNLKHREEETGKGFDTAAFNSTSEAHNPIMDAVVKQYGPGDIQIVDGKGNASPLTGSKAQMSALAKGEMTWKRKGDQGNGMTLAQTPRDGSIPGGGGGNTKVDFSPAEVKISFGSNGQPTASPNPVKLSPNAQRVNAGYGSDTMNNRPPGDGHGYGSNVGQH